MPNGVNTYPHRTLLLKWDGIDNPWSIIRACSLWGDNWMFMSTVPSVLYLVLRFSCYHFSFHICLSALSIFCTDDVSHIAIEAKELAFYLPHLLTNNKNPLLSDQIIWHISKIQVKPHYMDEQLSISSFLADINIIVAGTLQLASEAGRKASLSASWGGCQVRRAVGSC